MTKIYIDKFSIFKLDFCEKIPKIKTKKTILLLKQTEPKKP